MAVYDRPNRHSGARPSRAITMSDADETDAGGADADRSDTDGSDADGSSTGAYDSERAAAGAAAELPEEIREAVPEWDDKYLDRVSDRLM